MGFTNKDILEVIIMLVTISVGVGKYITDIKNIKTKHKEDMELINTNHNLINQRICKTENKMDKLEVLIIDMKWLKEAMKEIKTDIKELKSK